jgi:CDP-2,3-bis-(O-geranylgeranyl)-sn-glycerol synthase
MTTFLIEIFWLMLPAAAANMAPPLVRHLPILKQPLDFDSSFRGKRITGDNKTYRGLVAGILAALLVVLCEKALYPVMSGYSLIDYATTNPWLLGFWMGAGALLGDALKSFFKRQLNIPPGAYWIPFDQIDWIFGTLFFLAWYIRLSLPVVVGAIVLMGTLHVIVNYLGVLVGINIASSPVRSPATGQMP